MTQKRKHRSEGLPDEARHLVLVLGDQLDPHSRAFDGFDAKRDVVWMAEVKEESTHVWSHKARTALFLSAMRHFRDSLRRAGRTVVYTKLHDPDNKHGFSDELSRTIEAVHPNKLIVLEPGEYRVARALELAAKENGIPLEVRTDSHFFYSQEQFREHAEGRKELRMEYFYRELRRKTGVLMDDGKPTGGEWNYDAENRGSFGKKGPGKIPLPMTFDPDATTQSVLESVAETFPDHPGSLDRFDWPVTPEQAENALEDFIENRLPRFGQYQDAMWDDHAFLYHSRLSSAMNLKLLDPRHVVQRVEEAYRRGDAPLAAAEGFIRQILGWREYVRGIYWQYMPKYAESNALKADHPLPNFYWTAATEMNCLRQVIGQTLETGYAHHIQRLMVTGLFSLLLGVNPREIHEWYLAVYVDAVEWVELPNVIGMSQFADGGLLGSKPYVATGKYINRMSNHCKGCRYDPNKATGEDACPFTTLYWDFLHRHKKKLSGIPRMNMQLKNLDHRGSKEIRTVRKQAGKLKDELID